MAEIPYDAVLLVSFGGPEGPDDVMPFLRNVLRGRDVPEARMLEVAEQYQRFGGVSPINGHNRALVAALEQELASHSVDLPVYWGNRNWHPMLADTVTRMAADGVRHALAFVTSAYASYSACRQYLEDIEVARAAVAGAPVIDKLRLYFDHPGFVEPLADQLRAARLEAGPDAAVLFTAHSIPRSMAATSAYESQLRATAGLVAAASGDPAPRWDLVFQSRSGPPSVPWLEPDVRAAVTAVAARGDEAVVVAPIGFTSDHMEVLFDLDTQAAATAAAVGVRMVRAGTPGTDARFVAMIRELVAERTDPGTPRRSLTGAPWPDVCPAGCCPPPARRPPPGPIPEGVRKVESGT